MGFGAGIGPSRNWGRHKPRAARRLSIVHPKFIVTDKLTLDGRGKEQGKNVELLSLSLGIGKEV